MFRNMGDKGFLSLIDGILAIFLIFIAIIAFNMVVDVEIPSLSQESRDFKTSQDLMELMTMDVDGKDYSIIEKISYILSKSKNNKASQREVGGILDSYFSNHLDSNYAFVENNYLKGRDLSSNGDKLEAENLTVATRNYGNYSYTLYIW